MARRRWVERDHPRHPGGSDQGGRFRDRVGSGGWAAKISQAIGSRRGGRDFDPMRGVPMAEEGDRSWLGGAPPQSPSSSFDALPDESIHGAGAKRIKADDLANRASEFADSGDYEVYDPDSGKWGVLRDVFHDDRHSVREDDESELDRYVELDGDGLHYTAGVDEHISIRRKRNGKNGPESEKIGEFTSVEAADRALQSFQTKRRMQSYLDDADRADEQMRRELAAENDAEFGGEAELERGFAQAGRSLSNQEVAAALAPQGRTKANRTQDRYNQKIVEEALATHAENDVELEAQIAVIQRLKRSKKYAELDRAVDHLRRMLTISYLDEEDLPPLPPGRRSGTTGI